jgi:excisionase family DNA binding protein
MKLLTYTDLAKDMSLSIRYLQKLVKQGGLPHIRFGRAVRFEPNAIAEWIKEHQHDGKSFNDSAANIINFPRVL